MITPRISASSYSNTAPLVWSFLYGSSRGKVEIILDNAPARSAELLAQDRVDVALVPVVASQLIEGVKLIPDVCVGARRRAQSVCLVTSGSELSDVRSVALDTSSRTSAALTKIIFREFLGFEPEWRTVEPDIGSMLEVADAAMLIGDPALALSLDGSSTRFRTFDIAELWNKYTGLGFVFAMWMTRRDSCPIDLEVSRDEGVQHIPEIAANYAQVLGHERAEMVNYLSESISYSIDEKMQEGMDLYLDLVHKHGLSERRVRAEYLALK